MNGSLISALFDLLRIVDDHLLAVVANVCDTGRPGPVVGAEKDFSFFLLRLKEKEVRLDCKIDFSGALDKPFFHLLSTGRTLHLQSLFLLASQVQALCILAPVQPRSLRKSDGEIGFVF